MDWQRPYDCGLSGRAFGECSDARVAIGDNPFSKRRKSSRRSVRLNSKYPFDTLTCLTIGCSSLTIVVSHLLSDLVSQETIGLNQRVRSERCVKSMLHPSAKIRS